MNLAMPTMLSWVLGGNLSVFDGSDRRPLCHLCDKPKHFEEQVPHCKLIPSCSQLFTQHGNLFPGFQNVFWVFGTADLVIASSVKTGHVLKT